MHYRFLDREDEIEEYIASLYAAPILALDIEADSLYSYQEKVCLLQVSIPSGNTILDPLTGRNALKDFGYILANSSVEKVFHGGDYDVRLLKKDYGFEVRNLFDTMIAAQFTGRIQFGLAALLEEYFEVRLNKKYQRADWSARPLHPELLNYAVLDTAYLLQAKTCLEDELIRLGRLKWVREEFRLLEAVSPAPTKRPWCLDVKGARRLSPKQLAILQALLEMRDEKAKEWDCPPFKVLSNQTLLSWAQSSPTSREEILETPGVGKKILLRLASNILEAIHRGQSLLISGCPQTKNAPYVALTKGQEEILKCLKKARSEVATRLGLNPGLLVNSATLEKLCRIDPEEASVSLEKMLKCWQLEVVGDDIRRVLSSLP